VLFEILGCDKSWFELEEAEFRARLSDLQARRNARRLSLIHTAIVAPSAHPTKNSDDKVPVPSVSLVYSLAAAKDASPWDKLAALSLVAGRDKIGVEIVDLERQTYRRKTWRPPPQFTAGEHRGNPRGAPIQGHTVLPASQGDSGPEIPPVMLGLQGVNLQLRGFSSYRNRSCAVLMRTESVWILNFLPWHSKDRVSNGAVVPAVKDTKIKDDGTLKIEIDPSPLLGEGKTINVFVFVHQDDIVETYRDFTRGKEDIFQKQFLAKNQLDRFATWFSEEHAARRAALCGASYHQGWPETDEV
jgi:hypothetical protein